MSEYTLFGKGAHWRQLHIFILAAIVIALTGCKDNAPQSTPTIEPTVFEPSITPIVFNPSPTIPTREPLLLPTITPMPTATIICNLATFVMDVTYPDRTQVLAGSRIEKTWRIKNVGACGWSSDYKFSFVEGDLMSTAETSITNGVILPNMEVDITVPMTVPNTKGLYQATYMIRSGQGVYFGTGSRGEAGIWVILDVLEPTEAVTGTSTPTPTADGTFTETTTPTLSITETETPSPTASETVSP